MVVRELPEKLQNKANEELHEVPSRRQADIEHILDWLSKQPHLNVKNDDQTILNFLRHGKFSLEKTKERLDRYYTVKTMFPELFTNRDPFLPKTQEILRRNILTLLSDPSDPLSPIVIIMRWSRADPDQMDLMDVVKVLLMAMEIALNESDHIVVNGFHLLVDLKNLHNMYIVGATPTFLKKISVTMFDLYPVRFIGDHVVNTTSFMETMLNLFKVLLKEKLRSRYHFYKDLGLIHRDIPLTLLPDEYGGTAGPIEEISAKLNKKIESYKEWFLEEECYRNDESKRVGTPRNAADLTGVEGSFRQLQVD